MVCRLYIFCYRYYCNY